LKRFMVMLAVMALLMVALAVPAFAAALPGSQGTQGQGQLTAFDNCEFNANQKQSDKGVIVGGGPKVDVVGPTNCGHFFQQTGLIGNQLP
jgi:hypothetical protein